jgi:LL-diaminopimelate aminotransferase
MPLTESNRWLPDLDAIPADVASRARVIWLNYPNNPTGAVAELSDLERAVNYAKRHDIALMHDACYTEVAYDGYRPPSLMQVPGAMDVGLEFHSLSKTYNMTGWRVGMAVGNPDMIDALMVVKSNLDSGVPQAVQYMAIEALKGPIDAVNERNAVYQRRRDRVVGVLRDIGIEVETPRASLYVWARVPRGYTSAQFTEALLEERDIVVTPGTGYGEQGEGYVRLSLTIPDDEMEKGLERLSAWEIPQAPAAAAD